MTHLLFLGAAKPLPAKYEARAERCDDCMKPIWLAENVFQELDTAEDQGRNIVVLCWRCGGRKYGTETIRKVMTEQGLELIGE